MKTAYQYDETTKEYVGETFLQIDYVASDEAGTPVYAPKPNVTEIVPPSTKFDGKALIFNTVVKTWEFVDDFRGKNVCNVQTKQITKWNKIERPELPYILDIPSNSTLNYCNYDEQSNSWKVVDRQALLNAIWDLRKEKRDIDCNSDLEYNGHLYHVDPVSLNDIMLSAQEFLLTQDATATKRWVTADDINVTLIGPDFIAILQAYGSRRQRLVYESNDAWQEDLHKSDNELLEIFDSLTDYTTTK